MFYLTLLNELWIISSSGIPCYHQAIVQDFDESLFGGFISAILNFIKELGEDDIKKLEMGESKISILSSEDREWFFIARTGTKVKEKKIKNYLKEIRQIFFYQYGQELVNWNNNTELFQGLDEYIDISNPLTPDKIKQNEQRKSRGAFL